MNWVLFRTVALFTTNTWTNLNWGWRSSVNDEMKSPTFQVIEGFASIQMFHIIFLFDHREHSLERQLILIHFVFNIFFEVFLCKNFSERFGNVICVIFGCRACISTCNRETSVIFFSPYDSHSPIKFIHWKLDPEKLFQSTTRKPQKRICYDWNERKLFREYWEK